MKIKEVKVADFLNSVSIFEVFVKLKTSKKHNRGIDYEKNLSDFSGHSNVSYDSS